MRVASTKFIYQFYKAGSIGIIKPAEGIRYGNLVNMGKVKFYGSGNNNSYGDCCFHLYHYPAESRSFQEMKLSVVKHSFDTNTSRGFEQSNSAKKAFYNQVT